MAHILHRLSSPSPQRRLLIRINKQAQRMVAAPLQ
jgi:hypothetical protein